MDYVYICRDGDNEELRYSIRSVIANGNPDKIWVVGGKPDWYSGNFISVAQNENKYNNVLNNLKAICNSAEISSSFILMNDDFFIMKKINGFNNYNGGILLNKIHQNEDIANKTLYFNKLNKTYYKLLDLQIKEPLNYELHVPILIEKNKLKRILKDIKGCLFRSLYGNLFLDNTKYIDDVKINLKEKNKDGYFIDYINKQYMSSQDESFIKVLPILNKKFNKPSIFEIN
jgi:hypothetical protein